MTRMNGKGQTMLTCALKNNRFHLASVYADIYNYLYRLKPHPGMPSIMRYHGRKRKRQDTLDRWTKS